MALKIVIPKKYQERVQDLYRDQDGYWIDLKRGWRRHDNLCHIIHEDTQKELLNVLRKTIKCNCDYCNVIVNVEVIK